MMYRFNSKLTWEWIQHKHILDEETEEFEATDSPDLKYTETNIHGKNLSDITLK